MRYMKDGCLHDFLSKKFENLKWKDKIIPLHNISDGLEKIHEQKIIHHDLHGGNILQIYHDSYIADLGLSIPADESSTSNENNKYGVLPYVAPEVLNGKPYTTASDIYSFGVLMSVISTGQQPFHNIAHDTNLAFKICEGVRPAFSINTPKFYIELAYKCMNANPDRRPTAEEIHEIIEFWRDSFDILEYYEIRKEFEKMDEIKFDPLTITAIVHPNAVYTSRLLKFTNLPQPVNSNKVTIIGNNDGK